VNTNFELRNRKHRSNPKTKATKLLLHHFCVNLPTGRYNVKEVSCQTCLLVIFSIPLAVRGAKVVKQKNVGQKNVGQKNEYQPRFLASFISQITVTG
jgi:hypothetical protein